MTVRKVVVVLTLVVLAACGSTVNERNRQALQAGGDDGSLDDNRQSSRFDNGSSSGGEGGGTDAASGGGGGGERGDAGTSGRGFGGSPSGGGGSGSTGLSGGGGGSAPGVTATEIHIGVGVLENGDRLNEAIGSNISTGDQRRQYEILFEDLNKRGGIAGRKAIPVFFKIDALSGEPADAQAQAACEHFTQDNKVFAALGGAYDTFLECMTKAGTVQVTSDLTSSSTERFAAFPRYVEVSSPNLERQAAAWPPHLTAMGYFGSGAKVGVLSYDDPHFVRALDKALIPELRKLGHAPERILVSRPQSTSGLGQVAADAESAAFQFKARGVTHVLILDERANLTMFFMRAAESQGYNPRYGFNTQNAMGFLISTDPPQVNPDQLRGAVGIGWAPFMDEPQAPDSEGNEPMRRCTKLMQDNGIVFADSNVQAIAMQQCDNVWFLETIVELGGPVTAQQFMRNVEAIGDRYLSPHNFRNRFGGRRDGTAALRRMAFFEDCTCVRYTSGVIDF